MHVRRRKDDKDDEVERQKNADVIGQDSVENLPKEDGHELQTGMIDVHPARSECLAGIEEHHPYEERGDDQFVPGDRLGGYVDERHMEPESQHEIEHLTHADEHQCPRPCAAGTHAHRMVESIDRGNETEQAHAAVDGRGEDVHIVLEGHPERKKMADCYAESEKNEENPLGDVITKHLAKET